MRTIANQGHGHTLVNESGHVTQASFNQNQPGYFCLQRHLEPVYKDIMVKRWRHSATALFLVLPLCIFFSKNASVMETQKCVYLPIFIPKHLRMVRTAGFYISGPCTRTDSYPKRSFVYRGVSIIRVRINEIGL